MVPSSAYTFWFGPMPAACMLATRRFTPRSAVPGVVRTLDDVGLEARVVHEEAHVGVGACGRSDVGRRRERRRVPERRRQPLVRGDGRHTELDRVAEERVAHAGERRIAVVESPGVPRSVVEIGEVGEHLPAHDRVARHRVAHRVEVGLEIADVRERLRVEQHALVVARGLGQPPGVVHRLGRQRAAFGCDRQRRQRHHRRVAAEEHLLHEVVDREAHARVGLAAVALGNALQNSRPCTVPGSTEESRPPYSRSVPARRRRTRSPASAARAASGSTAAGGRHRERPARACGAPSWRVDSSEHALMARSVVAAPHSELQEAGVATRRCAARWSSQSCRARRCASRATGDSGAGSYSPFEQGPSSMGRSTSSSTPEAPRRLPAGRPTAALRAPARRADGR